MVDGPLKVALFNDTAPSWHFGCEAVMAAIERNVHARGGLIIHRHPVHMPWAGDRLALRAIADADLVLVNAEGTIHHESRWGAELARLGPYCAERGTPCHIVNATIQANGAATMGDLAAFSSVWVRESRSAEECRRWGVAAEICGDLSFFHRFVRHQPTFRRGVVIDSVMPAVNAQLGKMATGVKAEFVTMTHSRTSLKAFRRTWLTRTYATRGPFRRIRGVNDFERFAGYLARHRFVVTGRFHGLCFALNAGVPFQAVSSNSWKSEALLADVGLGQSRVAGQGGDPLPFSPAETEAIAEFTSRTRRRIAAMFDAILGLRNPAPSRPPARVQTGFCHNPV